MPGQKYDIHDAQAFALQPLASLKFKLDEEVAASLSQAEAAVWDLNRRPYAIDRQVLANAMLNIEALASVRMDGHAPSAGDILTERAYALVRGLEPEDHVKRFENDRRSLEYAIEHSGEPCTVELFKEIHKRVLPAKHQKKGGILRSELVQVGGSRYHNFGDPYRMPLPQDIEPLLEDMTQFLLSDNFLVTEQAGLAHAQLINIHPFERGNGKMARAVVHYILRNQGVAPFYLLPVTPTIVTSSHDYVTGINSCAIEEGCTPEEAGKRLNAWLAYFSGDCMRAVAITSQFIKGCERVVDRWRSQLNVRSDNSGLALLNALPALPVFNAQMVADYLGCSFKRASEACKLLVDVGAIKQVTEGRRNRVYSCQEIVDAYQEIDALR